MNALTTFHAEIKHILEQARAAMNAARIMRFSTQRVENPDEVGA
jgi:hypothetical protein